RSSRTSNGSDQRRAKSSAFGLERTKLFDCSSTRRHTPASPACAAAFAKRLIGSSTPRISAPIRLTRTTSNLGNMQFVPLSVPHLAGNEWKYVKECLDT